MVDPLCYNLFTIFFRMLWRFTIYDFILPVDFGQLITQKKDRITDQETFSCKNILKSFDSPKYIGATREPVAVVKDIRQCHSQRGYIQHIHYIFSC